ncbi:hypothetical protein JOF35_000080 [Streptomyces demainii]|uniref:Uncharacterized protein n=1 Tax=Streptomyces demainii TaxID=588122 RepID=A0ABT9KHA2_9ACTN|nr:hypothetical protein [Streptomyces demainii]
MVTGITTGLGPGRLEALQCRRRPQTYVIISTPLTEGWSRHVETQKGPADVLRE